MAHSLLLTLVLLSTVVSFAIADGPSGIPRGKRRRNSGGRSQHPLRAATGYSDQWVPRKIRGGGRAHHPARLEVDGVSLEGLRPVRVDMGPGRAGLSENRLIGTRKGRGHGERSQLRRHGGKRDKGRHGQEPLPSLVVDEPPPSLPSSWALPGDGPSPSPFGSGSSMVVTVTDEHPPTLPPASSKPQRPGRGKKQGEVMPTLDMALFDWTDYEDMKPADAWPSSGKKDKRRSKNLSSGNATADADDIEACDHHLDCLAGSCCDLRQHECKAHNRGLNNKCYDDCMCEEGFRCYAKFHRKRRVTRRRGRCVAPESVSGDQGGFITI
ncbi:draxin [Hippocampus zosterae]|uniref:draxin n=1 Tax=Hippocampus zosterae TaxID=109293 RepID=UPI00223D3EF3|nr:draxin [Hippocampus zosterae]